MIAKGEATCYGLCDMRTLVFIRHMLCAVTLVSQPSLFPLYSSILLFCFQ